MEKAKYIVPKFNMYGEEKEKQLELFKKVLKYAIETQDFSMARMQRVFNLEYIKTARLLDSMIEGGFIEETGPRKIVITMEEFNKLFGE